MSQMYEVISFLNHALWFIMLVLICINLIERISSPSKKLYKNILYKQSAFTKKEAICILSGDRPANIGILYFRLSFKIASQRIQSAIDADELIFHGFPFPWRRGIKKSELKAWLKNEGEVIEGFTDLTTLLEENNYLKEQFAHVQSENEQLRQYIAKLEAEAVIQGTKSNEKSLATREKNNGARIIAVLADLAHVDLKNPYSIHEALAKHAKELKIINFPSEGTFKSWADIAQEIKEI